MLTLCVKYADEDRYEILGTSKKIETLFQVAESCMEQGLISPEDSLFVVDVDDRKVVGICSLYDDNGLLN